MWKRDEKISLNFDIIRLFFTFELKFVRIKMADFS